MPKLPKGEPVTTEPSATVSEPEPSSPALEALRRLRSAAVNEERKTDETLPEKVLERMYTKGWKQGHLDVAQRAATGLTFAKVIAREPMDDPNAEVFMITIQIASKRGPDERAVLSNYVHAFVPKGWWTHYPPETMFGLHFVNLGVATTVPAEKPAAEAVPEGETIQ